jgi:hypothetical protein
MKLVRRWIVPVLVLVGAAALIGLGRQIALSRRDSRDNGNRHARLVMFGGTKIKVGPEQLTHREVTAIFGGLLLDLREAHIDDAASVNAFAMFGGVQILVPDGWQVLLRGVAIFGGYDNRTGRDGSLPPDAARLEVNATAIFGGVEVTNGPC